MMPWSFLRGCTLVGFLSLAACGSDRGASPSPPVVNDVAVATFVGSDACGACHAQPLQRWQGSHHELAMQRATDASVAGRFDGQAIRTFGTSSRPFQRDGAFLFETQGADARPHAFQVDYTLGVYPLQQYLVPTDNGRYQALTIAWDTRAAKEGGQRWFNLQPEAAVPPGDALHWTGASYNWNSRCAECHTTGLRKNFDAATQKYASTWKELGVGCESCHGPGSEHVRWVALPEGAARNVRGDKGLVAGKLASPISWTRDPGEVTAHASGAASLLRPTALGTGAASA